MFNNTYSLNTNLVLLTSLIYLCLIVQQVEGLSGGEEGGTYFVDQSGQYYYQANSDEPPVMTQVQIQEVEETDVQNEGEANQDEQYHEIEELENADGDEDVSNIKKENCSIIIFLK